MKKMCKLAIPTTLLPTIFSIAPILFSFAIVKSCTCPEQLCAVFAIIVSVFAMHHIPKAISIDYVIMPAMFMFMGVRSCFYIPHYWASLFFLVCCAICKHQPFQRMLLVATSVSVGHLLLYIGGFVHISPVWWSFPAVTLIPVYRRIHRELRFKSVMWRCIATNFFSFLVWDFACLTSYPFTRRLDVEVLAVALTCIVLWFLLPMNLEDEKFIVNDLAGKPYPHSIAAARRAGYIGLKILDEETGEEREHNRKGFPSKNLYKDRIERFHKLGEKMAAAKRQSMASASAAAPSSNAYISPNSLHGGVAPRLPPGLANRKMRQAKQRPQYMPQPTYSQQPNYTPAYVQQQYTPQPQQQYTQPQPQQQQQYVEDYVQKTYEPESYPAAPETEPEPTPAAPEPEPEPTPAAPEPEPEPEPTPAELAPEPEPAPEETTTPEKPPEESTPEPAPVPETKLEPIPEETSMPEQPEELSQTRKRRKKKKKKKVESSAPPPPQEDFGGSLDDV
jgi:hypothetical protein